MNIHEARAYTGDADVPPDERCGEYVIKISVSGETEVKIKYATSEDDALKQAKEKGVSAFDYNLDVDSYEVIAYPKTKAELTRELYKKREEMGQRNLIKEAE